MWIRILRKRWMMIFNSSETRFDNNRWIELGTTPEALIQSGNY